LYILQKVADFYVRTSDENPQKSREQNGRGGKDVNVGVGKERMRKELDYTVRTVLYYKIGSCSMPMIQ